MAAEQGLTSSQYNVGVCYEKGDGVERDLDEARRWYARAAAKGHQAAIERLAELNRSH
jgi:TPR repeat protein